MALVIHADAQGLITWVFLSVVNETSDHPIPIILELFTAVGAVAIGIVWAATVIRGRPEGIFWAGWPILLLTASTTDYLAKPDIILVIQPPANTSAVIL